MVKEFFYNVHVLFCENKEIKRRSTGPLDCLVVCIDGNNNFLAIGVWRRFYHRSIDNYWRKDLDNDLIFIFSRKPFDIG